MVTFLTWLAVAAGIVGGLVVIAFFVLSVRNEETPEDVLKEREHTRTDQDRNPAGDGAPR
jgi:hypothetical protein